jgi:hypothetical protein
LATKLNPIEYPRGIFKYKKIEEANIDRYKWELDHAVKREKLLNDIIGIKKM